MARQGKRHLADIDAAIRLRTGKSLLRFNTCGSVDDGKSTLIGRLLFESKALFDDQLADLAADSKKVGTRPGELDYALLLDGLSAEREQGITIDVAYRFFSTERRNFIVADTPGHEQYTRNMVTGASTADLSVIVVDARKGVLTQTRRHGFWLRCSASATSCWWSTRWTSSPTPSPCSRASRRSTAPSPAQLGLPAITCIPDLGGQRRQHPRAVGDDALVRGADADRSCSTASSSTSRACSEQPLRLPVRWVNRAEPRFRGLDGTIVAGRLRKGDAVRVQPSGRISRVARIVTFDGELEEATVGQSITIALDDEVDISRGDLIVPANAPAESRGPVRGDGRLDERRAAAARPQLPAARSARKTVTAHDRAAEIQDQRQHAGAGAPRRRWGSTRSASATCSSIAPSPFDPYKVNRDTGGFILVDRMTAPPSAPGMLHFALRRAQNVHWQAMDVNKAARAAIKGQKPCVLWYTGLSGAGQVDDRQPGRQEAARLPAATPTCWTATTSATG